MSDTKRLEWVMLAGGVEGFLHAEKDRYEYASEVAEEEGRDKPNAADELEGFRRCIDEEMRNNPWPIMINRAKQKTQVRPTRKQP